MNKVKAIFLDKMSSSQGSTVPFRHFETILKGNQLCPFSVSQKVTEDDFDQILGTLRSSM